MTERDVSYVWKEDDKPFKKFKKTTELLTNLQDQLAMVLGYTRNPHQYVLGDFVFSTCRGGAFSIWAIQDIPLNHTYYVVYQPLQECYVLCERVNNKTLTQEKFEERFEEFLHVFKTDMKDNIKELKKDVEEAMRGKLNQYISEKYGVSIHDNAAINSGIVYLASLAPKSAVREKKLKEDWIKAYYVMRLEQRSKEDN